MKVKVFDNQENNSFEIEAEHFLRIHKAYGSRFKPADEIAKKLVQEVNPDDIDIGVTKADEEKWQKSLEEAKEKERVDRLSKVVAEKLAVITNKMSKKTNNVVKSEQETETETEDNTIELPAEQGWSKKELEQMDLTQIIAIFSEIYPNKKVPKSKKEIIAEILK